MKWMPLWRTYEDTIALYGRITKRRSYSGDPVYKTKTGWWFFANLWWQELKGPYQTEEAVNAACVEYAKTL